MNSYEYIMWLGHAVQRYVYSVAQIIGSSGEVPHNIRRCYGTRYDAATLYQSVLDDPPNAFFDQEENTLFVILTDLDRSVPTRAEKGVGELKNRIKYNVGASLVTWASRGRAFVETQLDNEIEGVRSAHLPDEWDEWLEEMDWSILFGIWDQYTEEVGVAMLRDKPELTGDGLAPMPPVWTTRLIAHPVVLKPDRSHSPTSRLSVNREDNSVTVDGMTWHIPRKATAVVYHLLKANGRTTSSSELRNLERGFAEAERIDRILNTTLKKSCPPAYACIEAVANKGYRVKEEYLT